VLYIEFNPQKCRLVKLMTKKD